MRKTGSRIPRPVAATSPPPARIPEPRATRPGRVSKSLERPKKAHFLEPYRLSKTGRDRLIECLRNQGIGDRESRDLFAAAVEYGIARVRPGQRAATTASEGATAPSAPVDADPAPAPAPSDERPVASPPLAELALAARGLAAALDGLPPSDLETLVDRLSAADPFDRAHDRAFLLAVQREIERIAAAASAHVESSKPSAPPARTEPTAPAKPAASDALQTVRKRLIRQILDAYQACFELKPSPDPTSPLLPVLRIVADEARIDLPPADRAVAELLSECLSPAP
jgi:hypothetical protein